MKCRIRNRGAYLSLGLSFALADSNKHQRWRAGAVGASGWEVGRWWTDSGRTTGGGWQAAVDEGASWWGGSERCGGKQETNGLKQTVGV